MKCVETEECSKEKCVCERSAVGVCITESDGKRCVKMWIKE